MKKQLFLVLREKEPFACWQPFRLGFSSGASGATGSPINLAPGEPSRYAKEKLGGTIRTYLPHVLKYYQITNI
jgi:hypothetical protein